MNSSSVSELAISLPFTLSEYGKVSTTQSQEKIWADRVHTVIGTLVTERIMMPEFGTNIPTNVFSQYDAAVPMIKDSVTGAFNSFLGALTLKNVSVVPGPDEATLTVEVHYTLPNNQAVNIAYLTLDGSNPSTQETL